MVDKLEAMQAEITRLRGLLIDPGSPPWEDARGVLVAELRKAEMPNHARAVEQGEGPYIPSHIALNLIAHARQSTPANGEQVERAEAWLAEMLDQHDPMCGSIDRANTARTLAPLIVQKFSPTPTEDARERVKVLQSIMQRLLAAAAQPITDLPSGSIMVHDFARHSTARLGIALLRELPAIRTALSNKETDRHG